MSWAVQLANMGQSKGTVAAGAVLGGRPLLRRRLWGLHSVSSYMQARMRGHLIDGMDIPDEVIPDWRDTEGAGRVDPDDLRELPDRRFILYVGALRQIKGIEVLLEAYQQLDAPPPLVLIGPRAQDTPATFPIDVTVLEGTSQATVMAAWDRALIGVAPSIVPEPLGNVVHEAMSRGCR